MAYGYWSPQCVAEHRYPLSPDGGHRLSWSKSSFRISDTHTGRCIVKFGCANVVGGCFSLDQRCVAVCTEDGTEGLLQARMVADGVVLRCFRYKAHPKGTWVQYNRPVAFSGDGRAVYLGTPSGAVRIFPFPSREAHATHGDRPGIMRWEECDED